MSADIHVPSVVVKSMSRVLPRASVTSHGGDALSAAAPLARWARDAAGMITPTSSAESSSRDARGTVLIERTGMFFPGNGCGCDQNGGAILIPTILRMRAIGQQPLNAVTRDDTRCVPAPDVIFFVDLRLTYITPIPECSVPDSPFLALPSPCYFTRPRHYSRNTLLRRPGLG